MKVYSITHNQGDSYLVIDEETGISYSFDAHIDIIKEAVNQTMEYPSEAAEFDLHIVGAECFDEEGVEMGAVPKEMMKKLKVIMKDYLQEKANEIHEEPEI